MGWPKGRKRRKHTKEEKEHLSRKMKEHLSNPKARKKDSEALKKYCQEHPEYVKRLDKASTEWWYEHPNIRKEMSIRYKKLFLTHPEKFKKFMQYGRNSGKLHLKTKNGFLVRSQGEKTIANFLHDNKIKADYEKHTLIFRKEGQICIPDFYLPHYKTHKATYIEFYGGHPQAWKKKVLKNRLYKKYKIPCIFITPGELKDLGKWLKKSINYMELQKKRKRLLKRV
jgi:hypothetical protein